MSSESQHILLSFLNLNQPLNWATPTKKIYGSKDVKSFQKSITIQKIKTTLYLICSKVSLKTVPNGILDNKLVDFENKPRTNRTHTTTKNNSNLIDILTPPSEEVEEIAPPVQAVLNLLIDLEELLKDTPPFVGQRRYGNMACRDWHDKLTSKIDGFLDKEIQPFFKSNRSSQYDGFIKEVKYYFLGAFGSRERLDFGTGHELSFVAFISSLLMCQVWDMDTVSGTEYLIVFSKYYDLIKTLILTYTLEPAGSHGVWGLDDHFHFIYILGAAQLVDFANIDTESSKDAKVLNYRIGLSPSSVFDSSTLMKQRSKNLFYNGIAFIKKVKTGFFHEHSPLLYDICTTKGWEKIAKGMIKMYYGEVLSKFPVVQHFYFGNVLFPWINNETNEPLPESIPDEEPVKDESVEAHHRSEAEVAMNSLYQKRESELAKLIDNRRTVTSGLRKGTDQPSNGRRKTNNTQATTKAPWGNSDEITAAPWASNATTSNTPTAAPWSKNNASDSGAPRPKRS